MTRVNGKRRIPALTFGRVIGGAAVLLLISAGTAYAANEWTGANIVDGSLTTDDLANNTIQGVDIATGAVLSSDIANDTVTNVDIADNTVRSTEIQNNTIGSADVADGSLTSTDILDGTITGTDILDGTIESSDVLDESLTNADLGTDSVQATEVADNSLDSGEIIDFGLSNEDIGVLEAEVNADGTLASSDHFGTTSANVGTGSYQVDFGINVSFCTPVVTQGEAGVGGAGGAIAGVTDRSANANAFFVTMRDAAGSGINTAFHIIVVC
jgi:hypothetical protein